jgi:hypothetical protein
MLRTQRDLYDLPRGMGRFRRYLEVMTGGGEDIELPLPVFNPMGKGHVAATLDALLALDAEAVAAEAVREAGARLPEVPGDLRVGLVVADDLGGGWTNRHFTEIGQKFRSGPMLRRGWVVALRWTSEPQTADGVRREVLEAVHRALAVRRHGWPRTLGQMMIQEGAAAAFAGAITPRLDPDDLAYSRAVLAPHLDSDDLPVQFACLFGDAAALPVGYTPLGLSPCAGLAVALVDAVRTDS